MAEPEADLISWVHMHGNEFGLNGNEDICTAVLNEKTFKRIAIHLSTSVFLLFRWQTTRNFLKHSIKHLTGTAMSAVWATSRENVSSGIFDQVTAKQVCSATEAS